MGGAMCVRSKMVRELELDNNNNLLVFFFFFLFFFFKQKTAYEIGTGDWSSDVCSSDLSVDCSLSGNGLV